MSTCALLPKVFSLDGVVNIHVIIILLTRDRMQISVYLHFVKI